MQKSLIFRLTKTVLLHTSAVYWHWAETEFECGGGGSWLFALCLACTAPSTEDDFEDVAMVKIYNYVLGGRSLLCWLHLCFKQPERSHYIPIAKKGFARLAGNLSALSALVNQASNSLKCREMQSLRTFSFVTELHSPGPKGNLRGEGRNRA